MSRGGRERKPKKGKPPLDLSSDDDSISNFSTTSGTTKGTKSIKSNRSSKKSRSQHGALSDLGGIQEENNNLLDVDDILEQGLDLIESSTASKQKVGLDYLLTGLRKTGGECFVHKNYNSIASCCFRILNQNKREEFCKKACYILGILCYYELSNEEDYYNELSKIFDEKISEDNTNKQKYDYWSPTLALSFALASFENQDHLLKWELINQFFEISIKASKRCIRMNSNLNLEKVSKVTCSTVDTANLNSDSAVVLSKNSKLTAEKSASCINCICLLLCNMPKHSNKYRSFLKNKQNLNNLTNLLKHELSPEIRINTGILLAVLISKAKISMAKDFDGNIDNISLNDIIDDIEFISFIDESIKKYSNINEKTLGRENNKLLKSTFNKIEYSIFDNIYDDKKPINISANKFQAETIQFDCWEKEIYYDTCAYFLHTGLLNHLQTNERIRSCSIFDLPPPVHNKEDAEEEEFLKDGLCHKERKDMMRHVQNDKDKKRKQGIKNSRRMKMAETDDYA